MMFTRREFVAGLAALPLAACAPGHRGISVGTKNFTEQLLLGEILAQSMEAAGSGPIERRFYLAGSYICHQALLAGRIDTYVEYTGTALGAILKEDPSSDRDAVMNHVRQEYARRFGLEVMPSLGFNNSFAMVMRGEDARRLNVTRLSQLAPVASKLRIGIGYEFLERRDGLPGLSAKYNLKFAEAPRVMDLGLLYRAIQNRQVDIVAGSNTDGLIAALDLVVLEDDRGYFPPYDAVPIVRTQALDVYPAIRKSLDRLAGRVSAGQMRKMNYAVDGEKKDAAVVAGEFLKQLVIG